VEANDWIAAGDTGGLGSNARQGLRLLLIAGLRSRNPSAIPELSKRRPYSRNITSSFRRQQPVQSRKVTRTAAVNSALNRLLASVVSGKYKRPVAELSV